MNKCIQCGKPLIKGDICLDCYRKLASGKKPHKNKFNAKRVEINGIKFDSQLEAKRYNQLKLMERGGLITALKYHQKFELIKKSRFGNAVNYEADFTYFDKNGKFIVEDTKSKATITSTYKLKKRLLAENYGFEIKEIYKEDMR